MGSFNSIFPSAPTDVATRKTAGFMFASQSTYMNSFRFIAINPKYRNASSALA
jgi:hypothetical protein